MVPELLLKESQVYGLADGHGCRAESTKAALASCDIRGLGQAVAGDHYGGPVQHGRPRLRGGLRSALECHLVELGPAAAEPERLAAHARVQLPAHR